jgi:hypothetical protein
LLYVLGEEFDSYTAGAVWADTKMFAGHPRGWKKVAAVSVADWLENSIKGLRLVDAREGADLRHR